MTRAGRTDAALQSVVVDGVAPRAMQRASAPVSAVVVMTGAAAVGLGSWQGLRGYGGKTYVLAAVVGRGEVTAARVEQVQL